MQIVRCSSGIPRARVMDLHTSADRDWKEEIVPLPPHSELAFSFNFAIDSAEKWIILSRS